VTDLVALASRLAAELERRGIPYALGGALALGFHAPPRGTQDIDLNLFLDAASARPGLEALVSAGVDLDLDLALQGASFDARYARDQLVLHVGDDDLRVHELDRMLRTFVPGEGA